MRKITAVKIEYDDGSERIFWPSPKSGPEERQRLYEALGETIRPATVAQALDRAEDAIRDACDMGRCGYPEYSVAGLRDAIEAHANQ